MAESKTGFGAVPTAKAMRRRDFISLLGSVGNAALWPLAAGAQQAERMPRVGLLMNLAADDPVEQARIAVFAQAMHDLGWVVDRNVRMEIRWGMGSAERYRRFAAELVSLAPDVILTAGGTSAGALQQATSTIPIVFVETTDPVTRGLVASLNRPGGHTTGFSSLDFGMSGKWLELLKEIAPDVKRVAIIRNPAQNSSVGAMAAIQSVASTFRVELSPIDARSPEMIERTVTTFARALDGGLIIIPSASAYRHRKLIIALAARYRLPAVYANRFIVAAGGLISYGPDVVDQYRRAAGYVDRILKGEKPAELPVQAPTKYELVVNLRTAKALGLAVPPSILARADEVIE